MEGWEGFFVAEVGAAAVLAGLIFVGISMNIKKLLTRRLVSRAAWICLLSLVEVLVVSSYVLIPHISLETTGLLVGITGAVCWLVITAATFSQITHYEKEGFTEARPWYIKVLIIFLSQLITLPFIIAGSMLLAHNPDGMYWLVPGILSALPYSLYMGWVLTVEVNR